MQDMTNPLRILDRSDARRPSPSPPEGRRGAARHILLVTTIVLLLLLGVLGTLLWITAESDYDLDAELEAWKQLGGVTDPRELVVGLPEADDNAAPVYDDAHARLTERHADASSILSPSRSSSSCTRPPPGRHASGRASRFRASPHCPRRVTSSRGFACSVGCSPRMPRSRGNVATTIGPLRRFARRSRWPTTSHHSHERSASS
jgi:hypothetical protein